MRAKLPKCSAECVIKNVCCEKSDCRDWIDYKKLSPCIANKSHEFSVVDPSKYFKELRNI